MDVKSLTVSQLTALSNAFMQIDLIMEDDLPENFISMFAEYMAMGKSDRMQLQSELSVKANFLAYAESTGNEGMADALMKVADDLKDMSAKQLDSVRKDGVSSLMKLVK